MKVVKSQDIYGQQYDVSVDQLSWRPAAYAMIVRDGQIVLMRERGLYHLPGGGVDLGEMPEDGLVREVKEETGLAVTNPRLVGSLSTFFTLSHRRSDEPLHVQSLLLYYVCDLSGGNLSVEGLMADEKAYGLTPEWVALDRLDTIAVGSTVDWRPMVRRALNEA